LIRAGRGGNQRAWPGQARGGIHPAWARARLWPDAIRQLLALSDEPAAPVGDQVPASNKRGRNRIVRLAALAQNCDG
jgi:hypothetical protein